MIEQVGLSLRDFLASTAAGLGAGIVLPELAGVAGNAVAQPARQLQLSDGIVKIGILTDLNGPYRDFAGPGSVLAAQMAVEDFGGTMFGKPIQVTAADMAQMRAMPVEDFFACHGRVRQDGRMVHDMYLVRIKTPAASKGEWDLHEVVATIPAEEAFPPLTGGGCGLI